MVVEVQTHIVELITAQGEKCNAELRVTSPSEEAPDEPYEMAVIVAAKSYRGVSTRGQFFAMQDLRKSLEQDGHFLVCFGASINVYPSGMMDMGDIDIAYRMELGRHVTMADIVNIYDSNETVRPSTVDDQERFRQDWFASLIN